MYNKKVIDKKEKNLYIKCYKIWDEDLNDESAKNLGVLSGSNIGWGKNNSISLIH